MRHRILLASFVLLAVGLGSVPPTARAQDEEEELDLPDTEEEPRLRPPAVDPVDVAFEELEEEEDSADVANPEAVEDEEAQLEAEAVAPSLSVTEGEELLQQAAPPSSDPTRGAWTSPQSVVTLHGYLRMRGQMLDNLYLNRTDTTADNMPFRIFIPATRGVSPAGGCGGSPSDPGSACGGGDRLRWADMRLRLQPTIALSDDVRVHMMVDFLDNQVLGSTPDGEVYLPDATTASGFGRSGRLGSSTDDLLSQGVPLSFYTATALSPQAYRNAATDAVIVRRAYAEVTNRGLGQLRFGRMGDQWGLGMLWNAGAGVDADFSTDVDRIMGITKIAGIYFMGAWDFPGEGLINYQTTSLRAIPFDATNEDDIRQWTFAIAYREDEEREEARLSNGRWVLNGGIRFQFRKQFLDYANYNAFLDEPLQNSAEFVRRDARTYVPDLWGQFRYKSLRLEVEMAGVFGSTGNSINNEYDGGTAYDFRQFGIAFEGEYRLLEEKLGLYLYAGFATGDRDVDGLSDRQNLVFQQSNDNAVSAFSFHPQYRVDLILWRTMMGRVTSAMYMRPGVSYDIIRNDFGQLLGARLDIIYSRAANSVQTYGGNANLGLELDGTLYYRSEDGPDFMDGFYAAFQYGVLFPFDGLGYRPGAIPGGNPNLKVAQLLRLLMAVQF